MAWLVFLLRVMGQGHGDLKAAPLLGGDMLEISAKAPDQLARDVESETGAIGAGAKGLVCYRLVAFQGRVAAVA